MGEPTGQIVCLDFGTAWCKAAGVRCSSDGRFEPRGVQVYGLAEDGAPVLASALRVRPDRVLFGERALLADGEAGGRSALPFLSFKLMMAAPDLERMLAAAAAPKYDASGAFTQRDLLVAFLAYALHRLRRALGLRPSEPLPALRYTHPAWSGLGSRRWEVIAGMFAQADAMANLLGDGLQEPLGVPVAQVRSALDETRQNGARVVIGGVLEAAAACSAHALLGGGQSGALVVLDIGAGTSDFDAFELRGGRFEEIGAARWTINQAGDALDQALLNLILEKARHLKGAAAQGALWRSLVPQARRLKETLLAERKLAVRCGERVIKLTSADLERQSAFRELVAALTEGFVRTLGAVQEGLGPGKVQVLVSGGGASLPFLPKVLKARPKSCRLDVKTAPIRPDWADDPVFAGQLAPVFPQLAVAIGGAAAPATFLLAARDAVDA